MIEILKTLRDTPLPSILVVGGLVFLLLPFLKKPGGAIEIEPANKGVAAIIGIFLLASGIGLYILPLSAPPPTQTSSGQQSPSQPQSQLVIVITATPYPTLPATIVVVQPASRVQLVQSEMTGASTRKTYSITLASDEVIVGDAYDFQDKGYKCVVFMIRGPGSFKFTVLDGAWYRYSGIENNSQAEELLQERVQYLQSHWFCKNVAFPVERIER